MAIMALPGVTVRQILSYLNWNDKLNAASGIFIWSDDLLSSQAWSYVHFAKISCKGKSDSMLKCIHDYGKYFRHCVVELYDDEYTVASFLESLSSSISAHLQTLDLRLLQKPFSNRDGPDALHLIELEDHSSMNAMCSKFLIKILSRSKAVLLGFHLCWYPITKDLTSVLQAESVCGSVVELGLLSWETFDRTGALDVIEDLQWWMKFTHLSSLHLHLQSVTQDIILTLTGLSLRRLVVVNDLSTIEEEFEETIDWEFIEKQAPFLRVDYVFVERTLYARNLVSNPLVNTIFLDGLLHVDSNLFSSIGTLYGKTVVNIVLNDFHSLVLLNCSEETFITCFVSMLAQLPSLTTVVIQSKRPGLEKGIVLQGATNFEKVEFIIPEDSGLKEHCPANVKVRDREWMSRAFNFFPYIWGTPCGVIV